MKCEDIKEYKGKEVLVISKDGFRNYGIIKDVSDDAVQMKTPHGKTTISIDCIMRIRERAVVW